MFMFVRFNQLIGEFSDHLFVFIAFMFDYIH